MSELATDSLVFTELHDLSLPRMVEILPQLIAINPDAAYETSIILRASCEAFTTALESEEAPHVVKTLTGAMRGAHYEFDTRDYFKLERGGADKKAYHNLSNLITEDLGEVLIDCAEANVNSNLDNEIASLLLESRFLSAATSAMSPRMHDFLVPRLPQAVATVSGNLARGRGDEPAPTSQSEQSNVEMHAQHRISDALLELLPKNVEPNDPLKQSFSELFALCDTDDFIKLTLQTLLSWSMPDRFAKLLGIPRSNLAYALGEGFGKSGKLPLSVSEYKLLTMQRMFALEAKRPGICRTLFRENRFRNFGRHSEEFFLDVYDRRGDLQQYDQIVYILFNTMDHNGSVLRNSGPKLEQLRKELLAKNIGVVVAEFFDDVDLKILIRQARLAKLAKACIVVSDSHGDKDSIGSPYITKKMLQNWLGADIVERTTDDAELFLMACSAADYSDGFAAELYTTTDKRTVFAARGGAYLRRIGFATDKRGQPRLLIDSRRTGDAPGRSPLRTFTKGRSLALPIQRYFSPMKRKWDNRKAELA